MIIARLLLVINCILIIAAVNLASPRPFPMTVSAMPLIIFDATAALKFAFRRRPGRQAVHNLQNLFRFTFLTFFRFTHRYILLKKYYLTNFSLFLARINFMPSILKHLAQRVVKLSISSPPAIFTCLTKRSFLNLFKLIFCVTPHF